MWLGVVTPQAQFFLQWLQVGCDLPTLQHELAGRWPEGRFESVHAAIENSCLQAELVDPVGDQGTFPIGIRAWKFKCYFAPLVPNSLGDGFSALEVVHELLLVVVDHDSCRFISSRHVQLLKLAAAGASECKPDQDAMFETATLDEEHDGVQRVSVHDVIAKGDANHQAIRTMMCHLAEGRSFTTTNLNQERCKEVGEQARRAEATPKEQVGPSWFSGASPDKAKARSQVEILS